MAIDMRNLTGADPHAPLDDHDGALTIAGAARVPSLADIEPASLVLAANDESSAPYLPPVLPNAPVAEPTGSAGSDSGSEAAAASATPGYGDMPQASGEGSDAARELRAEAERKRKQGRRKVRLFLLLMLVGLAAGGFLVYQVAQTSEDADATAETEEATAAAEADGDAEAPVGETEAIAEGVDAVGDAAQPAAGGLVGAIDDARDLVDGINGEPGAAADGAAPRLIEGDVVPIVFVSVAERLPDEGGFERYVVNAPVYASANVGAYQRFVEVLSGQPQVDSDAFVLLGELAPDEIGLAIQRGDDGLTRVVAVAGDGSLAVDVTQ